jgi:hypothetical protein
VRRGTFLSTALWPALCNLASRGFHVAWELRHYFVINRGYRIRTCPYFLALMAAEAQTNQIRGFSGINSRMGCSSVPRKSNLLGKNRPFFPNIFLGSSLGV